jgi:hypothetical protein
MNILRRPIKTSNLLLIIGAVVFLTLLIIANFVLRNYVGGLGN